METPKHQFDLPRGHGRTVPEGIRDGASDPDIGERSRPRRTHEMGADRLRRASSPADGLKLIADGIRRMLPFGSPKGAGQHDQARRNTGGDARSQVHPPHGGTDARVHRQGRWRAQSAIRLRRYMDGPASRASIPPPVLREARLNRFPGALAVVPRHRIAACRRRVSDPSPTGLSDATKVGKPAYPPWPHSVCLPEGLAGGCAPSDPQHRSGTP